MIKTKAASVYTIILENTCAVPHQAFIYLIFSFNNVRRVLINKYSSGKTGRLGLTHIHIVPI